VRAGLELVAAVGGLKTHAPLQTRVGIATGLVVVGDLIGSGASREQAIVGETPNLAARLQGIAELEKTAHELTSAFGNHDVVRLFRWPAKVEMEALVLARPGVPMRMRSGFGRNVITSLIIIQPDRRSRRSSAYQH